VQIPTNRAEQGADPRAASVQVRQDFLENLVQVRLPLAGFPCGLAAIVFYAGATNLTLGK
jgi:hypothetical protein